MIFLQDQMCSGTPCCPMKIPGKNWNIPGKWKMATLLIVLTDSFHVTHRIPKMSTAKISFISLKYLIHVANTHF